MRTAPRGGERVSRIASHEKRPSFLDASHLNVARLRKKRKEGPAERNKFDITLSEGRRRGGKKKELRHSAGKRASGSARWVTAFYFEALEALEKESRSVEENSELGAPRNIRRGRGRQEGHRESC